MNYRWVGSVSLVVLAMVGCGGSSPSVETAHGPTYPIHLVRHPAVGTRWSEVDHFVASQEQTLTEEGAAPQTHGSTTTIDLAVQCEILAQDEHMEASRFRVTIDRFTTDTGAGPQTPTLPHVLLIDRGTPGSVTGENGEAVDAELVTALSILLPVGMPPADMDRLFGTSQPQPVGGEWPIDTASAAATLSGLGLSVDASHVQGSTTLVSAENDLLTLRTVTRASHVAVPGLPPGSVERRADVEAIQDDVLPLDESLPPPRDAVHASVDIEVDTTTPAGTAAHITMAIRQEMSHVRTMTIAP